VCAPPRLPRHAVSQDGLFGTSHSGTSQPQHLRRSAHHPRWPQSAHQATERRTRHRLARRRRELPCDATRALQQKREQDPARTYSADRPPRTAMIEHHTARTAFFAPGRAPSCSASTLLYAALKPASISDHTAGAQEICHLLGSSGYLDPSHPSKTSTGSSISTLSRSGDTMCLQWACQRGSPASPRLCRK
jgi:hypothetical protein